VGSAGEREVDELVGSGELAVEVVVQGGEGGARGGVGSVGALAVLGGGGHITEGNR